MHVRAFTFRAVEKQRLKQHNSSNDNKLIISCGIKNVCEEHIFKHTYIHRSEATEENLE